MEPIIKLENLSVVYNAGKSNEVWALDHLDADIYPDEYVVFFGPSGCGKSTLLYAIAGLEYPSEGQVIVDGRNLADLSEQEMIEHHRFGTGIIFQAFYLIASLSALGNIIMPQIFAGESGSDRKERALRLMRRFGIQHLTNKYPPELSGGQRQRVAVARALINDAHIILADEPTGNLDSENAEAVLGLLSNLNERDGRVIVHVTHNPQQLYLANRVFYMEDGKITRVTTNPKKRDPTGVPQRNVSPLEKLASENPHLSDSELRSKLIFWNLMMPVGIDDQRKIEALIHAYIQGKLTERELMESLDKPPEEGGVNLYSQTARSMAERVAELAHEMELIKGREEGYMKVPAEERAVELRGYLLDMYEGDLSLQQVQRLDEVLQQRLIGKLGRRGLYKALDRSQEEGGVGLNRRTAKRFAREVEVVLAEPSHRV